MSNDIFDRVIFLRTSDSSADREVQNYHFFHLTSQEFVTVQHFARCWISKTPLSYLEFSLAGQKNEKQTPPNSPTQREKYSGRYVGFAL